MDTARLNILDELYLHLDREDEPWSVHIEVAAEGGIDATRLAEAIAAAARRHPLARARLADSRATDVRYDWEILDELDSVPLEVVDCADASDVYAARERVLNRSLPLDVPGPFAVVLARAAGGDSLILNLHHAAGDGLSALRLMGSIARAYAGEDDPLPPVDPLAVRDIGALAGAQSLTERVARGRAALEYLTRGLAPPVRISPDGGDGSAGYGFELLELPASELAARRDGATVNDLLLGALAVAVRRWNAGHGGDDGSVYLMMPINLRPPEWRVEVVGNFASYVSVRLDGDELTDLGRASEAAAERTRRIKNDGIAGLIVDLFAMPTALPTGVKRRLQELIPLTGNLVVDTAVLSNLGRLRSVPRLGDAGGIRAVWFSPPGRMPLGASLGVTTLDERVFITLRYRHALFDAAAAASFAELLRETLVG